MKNSAKSVKNVLYAALFAVAGVMYCLAFNFDDAGTSIPVGNVSEILTENTQSGSDAVNVDSEKDPDEPAHIDINAASAEELTALPGIGEAKARSIVEFRNSNGDFSCVEDIMKVPGIKDKIFSKIKDYIYIGEE